MAENTEVYKVRKPCPCYDKDGNQIGWFNPRFLCTSLFAFAWSKKHKEWCVLSAERGMGSADFHGLMNCPCGYMDVDVNLEENAVKEAFEECGVEIDPTTLIPCGVEDSPTAYEQHVTHRFCVVLPKNAEEYTFSHNGNEVDEEGNLEVGMIKFIPISKVTDYNWAFHHGERIIEIAHFTNLSHPLMKFLRRFFKFDPSRF